MGSTSSYVFGLLFIAALLSVVLIPLGTTLVAGIFGAAAQPVVAPIVKVVLLTVILPFAVGVVVHHYVPDLAARTARPVCVGALTVLAVSGVIVLVAVTPAVVSLIGNGAILAFVAFVLVGLIAGHLLGGPDRDNRTVLALSSAARHPAVALAIASANFPQEKLVPPAVFLYLLVNVVVSIPYLIWQRRSRAGMKNDHRGHPDRKHLSGRYCSRVQSTEQ